MLPWQARYRRDPKPRLCYRRRRCGFGENRAFLTTRPHFNERVVLKIDNVGRKKGDGSIECSFERVKRARQECRGTSSTASNTSESASPSGAKWQVSNAPLSKPSVLPLIRASGSSQSCPCVLLIIRVHGLTPRFSIHLTWKCCVLADLSTSCCYNL